MLLLRHLVAQVYQSKFTNMYHSVTEHKTATMMKLICEGKNERVVGLHLLGIGSDEILQGFGMCKVPS